jgi:hypothetical protein
MKGFIAAIVAVWSTALQQYVSLLFTILNFHSFLSSVQVMMRGRFCVDPLMMCIY